MTGLCCEAATVGGCGVGPRERSTGETDATSSLTATDGLGAASANGLR